MPRIHCAVMPLSYLRLAPKRELHSSTACRGNLKETLLQDRDFILKIIKTSPGCFARTLLEGYKKDRQVLLKALASGLEWSEVPCHFQDDVQFVSDAIRLNPQLYMEISENMKENRDIAFQVLKADGVSDDVILEATDHVPELLSDREAMLHIAKNWWTDVLQETLQFSPPHIRSDKQVMLEAIKNDSIAFEYCSDELQQDRDVVRAAIEASPSCLYLVTDGFQQSNPDIVIMAIQRTDPDELWSTYDDINEDLWLNREVAMAWLCRGGDWLEDDFQEEFCDDKELLLAVAERNYKEFDYASDTLKSDKEFMLQAVAKDGRVFKEALGELRYDFDLALVAFSNSPQAIQEFTGEDDLQFMVSFAKQMHEQLAQNNIFNKFVVCAMSRPANKRNQSVLSMLNQGPETTLEYKQLIAEYLGLPHSEELQMLQKASNNLRHWGF